MMGEFSTFKEVEREARVAHVLDNGIQMVRKTLPGGLDHARVAVPVTTVNDDAFSIHAALLVL